MIHACANLFKKHASQSAVSLVESHLTNQDVSSHCYKLISNRPPCIFDEFLYFLVTYMYPYHKMNKPIFILKENKFSKGLKYKKKHRLSSLGTMSRAFR